PDPRELRGRARVPELLVLGLDRADPVLARAGRDRGDCADVRICDLEAAVPRLAPAVLAVHPVDDAALRGDPGAAVPRRDAAGPRRHLPGAAAPADGGALRDLPDEAVHTDPAERADRRRPRRRRQRAAHLLGRRAAAGAPRPG